MFYVTLLKENGPPTVNPAAYGAQCNSSDQSANTYKRQKSLRQNTGVDMKLSALLKAPLNYLPFSTSTSAPTSTTTPEKRESVAKKPPASAKNSRAVKAKKPVPLKPYRGTAIVFDQGACDAAKALKNKRFLVSERNTPMLPLPACDAASCNCRYKHYDDRREDDQDRRHAAALRTELYEDTGNMNRREKKRGRRKTDI
jgi:hypothetical protein